MARTEIVKLDETKASERVKLTLCEGGGREREMRQRKSPIKMMFSPSLIHMLKLAPRVLHSVISYTFISDLLHGAELHISLQLPRFV